MPETKNMNKIIAIVFVFLICISAIIIIYTNLPNNENENESDESENETEGEESNEVTTDEDILTVTFGNQQLNFTLTEIENLETFTANATMIKVGWLPEIVTEGPNEFTGVEMSTLFNQLTNLPADYYINVTSSDGRSTEFNMSQINGYVDIYNDTGTIIDTSGATMILAYKIDGAYIEEDEGPLRVVFCHEDYTPSNIWAKMVNSIELVEQ